jgi:hypothetical protein
MYWLTGNGGNRAKSEVRQVLRDIEGALQKADGPFLYEKRYYSGGCSVFIIFGAVERMAASSLFYKGFQIRVAKGEPTEFPTVNA